MSTVSLRETPPKVAVQVYCPAWDVVIALIVRVLDTTCPLVVSAVGRALGPTQWKSGVPATVPGSVREQVRDTEPPARREEVLAEVEITAGSAEETEYSIIYIIHISHSCTK